LKRRKSCFLTIVAAVITKPAITIHPVYGIFVPDHYGGHFRGKFRTSRVTKWSSEVNVDGEMEQPITDVVVVVSRVVVL
jgi:hypothetical protein